MNSALILGIETSCDETALALIETRHTDGIFECRVIASVIHSQADLHSPYGGVFPMLAKREHEKHLQPLFDQLLISLPKNARISAIAVTEGPGLEPALWTGITFAQSLGKKWGVPIIPVNHMDGHIVGSLLASDAPDGTWQQLKTLPLPALAFLISGGHTELISIQSSPVASAAFAYTVLGGTRDDAVGEAFDKVARLLGLPYPGGPHISRLAGQARTEGILSPTKLPRPMIHSADLQFSFSGLKTAVLYAVRAAEQRAPLDEISKKGLAREFEDAIVETLAAKLEHALDQTGARALIIGGGVSANTALRQRFADIASDFGIPIFLPSLHISGDNALMIALAGALNGTPADTLTAHGTKKLGDPDRQIVGVHKK